MRVLLLVLAALIFQSCILRKQVDKKQGEVLTKNILDPRLDPKCKTALIEAGVAMLTKNRIRWQNVDFSGPGFIETLIPFVKENLDSLYKDPHFKRTMKGKKSEAKIMAEFYTRLFYYRRKHPADNNWDKILKYAWPRRKR